MLDLKRNSGKKRKANKGEGRREGVRKEETNHTASTSG